MPLQRASDLHEDFLWTLSKKNNSLKKKKKNTEEELAL